jgi:hypothetical protein
VSEALSLWPRDRWNDALLENAHPPAWRNPTPAARYDLVVLGGGTAGLVSAIVSAGVGAKVALVEKHLLGGDCLNYGCVPSKTLLRSARAADDARDATRFGVRVPAGIEIVTPLTNDTGTVFAVNDPVAGTWRVRLPQTAGLDEVRFSAAGTNAIPTISLTSPAGPVGGLGTAAPTPGLCGYVSVP